MNVLKSLIGSVVGAALATVIHHFARPSASEPILWFPIVTGILTGLAGGVLGGKNRGNGGRLASGVLSALVAGGAIFGGDVVTSLTAKPGDYGPITREQLTAQPATSPEVASTTNESSDAASDATASSDTTTEIPVEMVDPANVASDTQDIAGQLAERSGEAPGSQPGQMYAEQSGQPAEASLLDKLLPFIFPGLGILLAYQFARGFRDSSQQG
jgi:hypothetical protein